jgi:DNA invertase Pin-like site-specific DNA recombinase
MLDLMLWAVSVFVEFERALISERQSEGAALDKLRGAYRGRKKALTPTRCAQLRQRPATAMENAQPTRSFQSQPQKAVSILKNGRLTSRAVIR